MRIGPTAGGAEGDYQICKSSTPAIPSITRPKDWAASQVLRLAKHVLSTRSRLERLQSMTQIPDVAIPEHHEPISGNSIPPGQFEGKRCVGSKGLLSHRVDSILGTVIRLRTDCGSPAPILL